ncbi:hypothetical protein, partial [Klebsiella pneumoniae]|uniref:hypothetical protein n=1 Tax=Klebsiella pneumoniae TaxID=573 RepID=UPI001D0E1257
AQADEIKLKPSKDANTIFFMITLHFLISDVRGSTTGVFSSITETSSAAFISPEEGWIFISWRTLTPGIDEAIQPS